MDTDMAKSVGGVRQSPFRQDALKGRVALITGGGSGIGLEVARQLGLHGCSVAVMGRRRQVLEQACKSLAGVGIQAVPTSGDVRNPADAAKAVDYALQKFGRLDILINGAAGNFLVPADELSTNGFKTVMDIDAVGTFTMCSAAVSALKKGGKGRDPDEGGGIIINISATLHYTAAWYQIHVSAAKAAVDALTRNLALEWGQEYGIRVNGIAPGPVGNTPGLQKLKPEEVGFDAVQFIPVGRVGEAWDIAMAVVYLTSEAGSWISGCTMIVDGGNWLFKPQLVPKDVVKALSRKIEKRMKGGQGGSGEGRNTSPEQSQLDLHGSGSGARGSRKTMDVGSQGGAKGDEGGGGGGGGVPWRKESGNRSGEGSVRRDKQHSRL